MMFAVSIQASCSPEERLALMLNEQSDRALPGGWIEAGESVQQGRLPGCRDLILKALGLS